MKNQRKKQPFVANFEFPSIEENFQKVSKIIGEIIFVDELNKKKGRKNDTSVCGKSCVRLCVYALIINPAIGVAK